MSWPFGGADDLTLVFHQSGVPGACKGDAERAAVPPAPPVLVRLPSAFNRVATPRSDAPASSAVVASAMACASAGTTVTPSAAYPYGRRPPFHFPASADRFSPRRLPFDHVIDLVAGGRAKHLCHHQP